MYRVMIVDDIEIMRRQIKRLSLWGENKGFNIVDEAEDGQDALDKLKKQPVDLLITDIRMPRVDGIELLREVYENDLATCTVFLSEHSEFNFAKEAIQYGIFDYLLKPVKLEELEKLLKKVKSYIEEKEKTQIQLKKLEDKLIDKIDVYYPYTYVNSIIKYISTGNSKALEAISNMIDETATILEHDILKTAIVLQKAVNDIFEGIKENYNWIEKFVDADFFTDINLTCYINIDLMKKYIIEVLEVMICTINRFIIDSKKNPLINEICNYTMQNIENNISIANISEKLFLTKKHIGDIFKQETDMTLGEYITMIKMERAKRLIINGSFKNYEVAQKLGYKDAEYFSKVFKKHAGFSPIEYRNTMKS